MTSVHGLTVGPFILQTLHFKQLLDTPPCLHNCSECTAIICLVVRIVAFDGHILTNEIASCTSLRVKHGGVSSNCVGVLENKHFFFNVDNQMPPVSCGGK